MRYVGPYALPILLVTAVLASIQPALAKVVATGGTITTYVLQGTNYQVHTFTNVGVTQKTIDVPGPSWKPSPTSPPENPGA